MSNEQPEEQKLQEEMAQQPDIDATKLAEMDEAMEAKSEEIVSNTDSIGDKEKLEAAQNEIAELKDTLLRTVAEQENFKKRIERERLSRIKYEGERILKEMLPVVDNLERAIIQGTGQDGVDAKQSLLALMEGVAMTQKILLANLAKFEVTPIESIGEPFDPQHQEALTMEASETVPSNHVVGEFEKGYFFKDRLLRPAKVIVSSGKV